MMVAVRCWWRFGVGGSVRAAVNEKLTHDVDDDEMVEKLIKQFFGLITEKHIKCFYFTIKYAYT